MMYYVELAILKEVKELCCVEIGEVKGRGKESWLLCRCFNPEDQRDSVTELWYCGSVSCVATG